MFCPRCRKFTDSPLPAQPSPDHADNSQPLPPTTRQSARFQSLRISLSSLRQRSRAREGHCSDCGALLTLDRLASEFPELRGAGETPGQAALAGPGGAGEPKAGSEASAASPFQFAPDSPVTVQELLRATAGPNPITGVSQIPLDQRQPGGGDRRNSAHAGGRREEDIELSGSRYQASETAQRRNRERKQREMETDWRQSAAPRIPRGFGGKQWTRPNLEVCLGLGTLSAVALLVVSMTLRVVFAPNGVFAPAAHPMAHVVNASALGYMPALKQSADAAPAGSFAATPAYVATEWRRVGEPVSIPMSAKVTPFPGQVDIAAYEPSGPKGPARVSPVRIWVQHLKSSADALACLTLLVNRRQELQSAEIGLQATAVRWETITGKRTALFNDAMAMSDSPNNVSLVSLRAWQQGSDVVTVVADDAGKRDDFVRDYLGAAS